MTRLLGCAALAVVFAVGLSAQTAKDGKDKPKVTKAGGEFARLELEYNTDLADAGRDVPKIKEIRGRYSPKFLAHAKANGGDDSAVPALDLVVQLNPTENKSKDRAEALALLKTYAKTKRIMPALVTLANQGTGFDPDELALEILRTAAKDNEDKLTRATAMDELARGLEFQSQAANNLMRDDKRRAESEERLGKDVVKNLIASARGATSEMRELRAALKKDYDGVLPSDTPEKPKDAVAVGMKAPAVTGEDITGAAVKLGDYAGKVVVLDFWATWCGPCKAMIPHTRTLVKANAKKPFAFVSVSCDANKADLEGFVDKNDMPWTHWWDGQGGKVSKAYEVRAFPTIYVVDHKGVIRFKSVGFDKELDEVVATCVKEAEAEKK